MADPSLFRPTLTTADDAVGFRQPWRPMSLAILAAFFGILSGGLLLALNERRLGRPERLWILLGLVACVFTLELVAIYLAAFLGWVDFSSRTGRGAVDVAGRVASGVVGVVIAQTQRRRYMLFEQTGEPGGNLLWPAIGSIALAILAQAVAMGPLLIMIWSARTT
jgi:hypothetical protein